MPDKARLVAEAVRMTGTVVKIGQIVRVKVLSVDVARKRIGLSIKAASL